MRAKTKLVTRAAPWRFKQAANSLTVCPLVITSSMTRICLFFNVPDEVGMINAPRKLFFLLLNARLLWACVWRILRAREGSKGSCKCCAKGLAISKDWLKPRSLSRCADKGIGIMKSALIEIVCYQTCANSCANKGASAKWCWNFSAWISVL